MKKKKGTPAKATLLDELHALPRKLPSRRNPLAKALAEAQQKAEAADQTRATAFIQLDKTRRELESWKADALRLRSKHDKLAGAYTRNTGRESVLVDRNRQHDSQEFHYLTAVIFSGILSGTLPDINPDFGSYSEHLEMAFDVAGKIMDRDRNGR